MGRPPNQLAAGREARELLARTLPGSRRGSVKAHLHRAEAIARLVWRRWHLGPRQWQVKHLRWYLSVHATRQQPSTAYRHWLTIRALVHALGRAEQWLPHLSGPWVRPTGEPGTLRNGRPPKLPAVVQQTSTNRNEYVPREVHFTTGGAKSVVTPNE